MMGVSFVIPGPPCGKGRPRFSTAGKYPRAYTPEKTAWFENLVRLAYAETGAGMLEGALAVRIKFYLQVPESRSKKDKERMMSGDLFPEVKPDIDNAVKAVLDGLNGVAFADDKSVIRLNATKTYAREPRTEVRIVRIPRRSELEAGMEVRENEKQSGDYAC